MAIDRQSPTDFHKNELRQALFHLLSSDPGSPTEGQFWWDTTLHLPKFYDGSAVLALASRAYVLALHITDLTAPAADFSMNSHKITSLATGTADTDAVNKAQMDAAVAGIRDAKDSVRIATAAALPAYARVGNVLTASANGSINGHASMDGATMAVNDRLLVNNTGSATGADRGIYVVTAVGDGSNPWVFTRASDADSSAEVTQGLFVWAVEGTSTNGNGLGWLLTTADPITLNTTSLSFTEVATIQAFIAGAGLTKTSNTVDLIAGSTPGSGGPGGGLKINADDAVIDTDVVVRKYAANIGDGSTTSIVVTHGLGTRDVTVSVHDNSTPWGEIEVEVRMTSTTTITLVFAVAPTTNQYRVVVHG